MKLKNKTIVPYKGKVHDLHVENSHSYNVFNLGVHNSAGGSLVCFVLGITDLDPIKWDCPFERFMSVSRCLDPNLFVKTSFGSKRLTDVEVGDLVQTHAGDLLKKVVCKTSSKHTKIAVVTVSGQRIKCSLNHKWQVLRDNQISIVETQNLLMTDKIQETKR